MQRWVAVACVACSFRAPLLVPPDGGVDAPPCSFPADHAVLESAHVRLAHPESVPVCGGTLEYLETAAAAQADLLDVGLETLCYTVWHPEAWAAGPCPLADACTQPDGAIHSPRPDLPHELVHSMREGAWTVPLFEEGVAVALGDDNADEVLERYDVPIEDLLLGARPLENARDYRIAGDFASYLVTRHSPERFRALLEAFPRQLEPERRLDAFRGVYGVDVGAMVDERWRSGWRFHGGDLGLPACAAAPVPWDGLVWQDGWTVACQEGAVGVDVDTLTVGIVNYLRRFATLDVAEAGIHRLDLSQSRRGAWLELGWCPDPGGASAPYESFSLGFSWVEGYTAFAALRPGRYALTSWASWPDPAVIDVTLERVSPSCDAPLAVSASSPPLFLAPHPDTPVAVTVTPSADVTLVADTLQGVALSSCPDCGACVPVAEEDRLLLAAGGRYQLVATGPHWGGWAYLVFRAP